MCFFRQVSNVIINIYPLVSTANSQNINIARQRSVVCACAVHQRLHVQKLPSCSFAVMCVFVAAAPVEFI